MDKGAKTWVTSTVRRVEATVAPLSRVHGRLETAALSRQSDMSKKAVEFRLTLHHRQKHVGNPTLMSLPLPFCELRGVHITQRIQPAESIDMVLLHVQST
jgi:hypothetical protein